MNLEGELPTDDASWPRQQPRIRYFRKKPIPIPMLEWTGENMDEIQEFTGVFEVTPADRDEPVVELPKFLVKDVLPLRAEIYNTEEAAWIPCPVGHFVVKGVRGEFYPISPAALEQSYDEVV